MGCLPPQQKSIAANGDLVLRADSDKAKRFAAGQDEHSVARPMASATKQLYLTQRQNDIDIAAALNALADLEEAGDRASALQKQNTIIALRASAKSILERDHESLHFICSLYKSDLIGILAGKPDGVHHSQQLVGKARCLGSHLVGRIFIGEEVADERTGIHTMNVVVNPAANIYTGRRNSPRAKQIAGQILGDYLDAQHVAINAPAAQMLDEHFERLPDDRTAADGDDRIHYRLTEAGETYWNVVSDAALEVGAMAAEQRITAAIAADDARAAAARTAAADE